MCLVFLNLQFLLFTITLCFKDHNSLQKKKKKKKKTQLFFILKLSNFKQNKAEDNELNTNRRAICCCIINHYINFFFFFEMTKATSRWFIFFPQLVDTLFLSFCCYGRFSNGSLMFKLLITNIEILFISSWPFNIVFVSFWPYCNKICFASISLDFFLISLISFKILFVCIIPRFVSISFFFLLNVSLYVLFSPTPQFLWNISKFSEIFLLLNLVASYKTSSKMMLDD